MRFQVSRLSKLLVTPVEGAHIGPVSGVDPHMCAQIEVQWEALPAALEGALSGSREKAQRGQPSYPTLSPMTQEQLWWGGGRGGGWAQNLQTILRCCITCKITFSFLGLGSKKQPSMLRVCRVTGSKHEHTWGSLTPPPPHIPPVNLAQSWCHLSTGCKSESPDAGRVTTTPNLFLPLWGVQGCSTWKGFSPVWTSWCRFSLELSTKALPHSAQTCTRGPWVWRCFLMAELSLNILVQPFKRRQELLDHTTWQPILAGPAPSPTFILLSPQQTANSSRQNPDSCQGLVATANLCLTEGETEALRCL